MYFYFVLSTLVVALLVAQYRKKIRLAGFFKGLASFTLLAFAISQLEQTASVFDYFITIGIGFGVIGDLMLISKKKLPFMLGMLSFLLGHIAYIMAMNQLDYSLFVALVTLATIGLAMYFTFQWFAEPLNGMLRHCVKLYMVALACMTAFAISIGVENQMIAIGAGATMFLISDFFVASHRFKRERFLNKLVGLPLYFLGQLLIATSISNF